MPLPELPNVGAPDTGPAPVEALPAPNTAGAAFNANLMSSLGVSAEGHVIGKIKGNFGTPREQQWVSGADAKKEMATLKYDGKVIPENGLTRGELDVIEQQQSIIARDRAIVEQGQGGFGTTLAGFAGAAADPLFLAAGPVAGRIGMLAKGMSVGGRIAAGAAEGSATMGAYDVGLRQFGTAQGDADIDTHRIVQDMLVGGVIGGAVHGIFGPRPEPTSATLKMLAEHKQTVQDLIPGVQISSGLRTVARNAKIGGAMKSMHLSGEAVDFVPPGKRWTQADLDAFRAKLQAKGLPVTELFVETEKDPHSTGYHVHWGWGEKGRPSFGTEAAPWMKPRVDWTDITPDDYPTAMAHAAQAADADSVVDLKPTWAKATTLGDEHDTLMQQLDTEAYQRAGQPEPPPRQQLPPIRPGSLFSDVPDREPFQEHPAVTFPYENQQPKTTPETTTHSQEINDLKANTDAAVAEAKARPAPENAEEHPFDAALKEAEDQLHVEGASDEMVKAIQAAVRCSLINGLD